MTMEDDKDSKSPRLRGVDQLRDLTERTGALHEEQLLQLKLWPMVVFDRDPDQAQAQVDQETMTISFSISWKARFLGRLRLTQLQRLKLRQGAERLILWTQNLLGPSWSVSVLLQEGDWVIDQFEKKVNLPEESRKDPFEELGRRPWRDKFKGQRSSP